ncbi:caffeoyl-CoA O-methyltransferase-like [Mizuhopecten yessoensis]|nr:caffeoyl-CoA O-methyltransferase-like [Mizuhopecten yessoensis]
MIDIIKSYNQDCCFSCRRISCFHHQPRVYPTQGISTQKSRDLNINMACEMSKTTRVSPVLRHLRKLQQNAKANNAPSDALIQIETCIDCIHARNDYCETISSPPSDVIDNIVTETETHPWQQVRDEGKVLSDVAPIMLSGALEGTFLKMLTGMSNAKRALEIGLLTGCSALSIAEALPADGEVVTCEISEYLASLARKLVDHSPHGKKIKIMTGPGTDCLQQMAKEGQKFDFVFIDADKPGYIRYYKIIMDNDMLTPRGTILVDNALYAGMSYLPQDKLQLSARFTTTNHVMREFNEYVYNDDRVSQVLLPIHDGVMIIRRKEAFEGTA